MATKPQLPTVDFSKFDLGKFDMTKLDITKLDITKLDVTRAVDGVTTVLRDGAYITIGLGVLGAQQAAEMAKATSVKVQDATKKMQDATKKAQGLTKQYADSMQQAGEKARTATETLTQQVRGLVGSAA